jgi:arsenate reductase (glutaredoxin)
MPKSPVTLLHNPRCSTSRRALALLQERGIDPLIVEYLKDPPTAGEIRDILKKMKASPRDLIRRKESLYRELGLDSADDKTLIEAMAAHPILIERPVVIRGARAALGRPLDNLESLL